MNPDQRTDDHRDTSRKKKEEKFLELQETEKELPLKYLQGRKRDSYQLGDLKQNKETPPTNSFILHQLKTTSSKAELASGETVEIRIRTAITQLI